MKAFQLFESGCLRKDAGQILVTFKYFPDDAPSRGQLYQLLTFEKERANSVGTGQYKNTGFSSIVEKYLARSEAQRGVSGLVTLCLAALKRKNPEKRPTLYGAAKLAARILKETKSERGNSFFMTVESDGGFIEKGFKAVAGRGDIEKRFRAYSCIGHLSGAELLTTENTAFSEWPMSLEANTPRLIRTIEVIEKEVVDVFPEYFPDPWRIGEALPAEIASLDPFDLLPDGRKLFGVDTLW